MLIEQIRQSTRQAHQELDQQVYPLIQQIKDDNSYVKMLETFYGYYKPVYGLLDMYLSNETVPDYTERRRPEAILNDINNFSERSEIALCSDVPVVSNISQALGAFYVLEGSTMGGQIISKKIAANLELNTNNGLSFFNSYGENNKNMWSNFLVSLNEQEKDLNTDEIILTAYKTFSKFRNWIINCYAAKPTVTS